MTLIDLEAVDGRGPVAPTGIVSYAEIMEGSCEGRKRFGAFLLAAMDQEHIGIADLSRRTGLRYAVIQRWVDPVVERRMLPSSANCHLIADALGLDEIVVLKWAGHVRDSAMSGPQPPFFEELQAILARAERYLREAPPEAWTSIVRPTFEAQVEATRVLVERLRELLGRP